MKIWIDILTPKQLLFSEPIIEKLGQKHDILCTSREYNEVTKLAKIRHFDLIFVGKHGGGDKKSKLKASIERIEKLSKKIDDQVEKIISNAYKRSRKIILENKDVLHKLADKLLEKEYMSKEEFAEILWKENVEPENIEPKKM